MSKSILSAVSMLAMACGNAYAQTAEAPPVVTAGPANQADAADQADATDDAREIVVTGSQIRGVAPVGSALINLDSTALRGSARTAAGTTADFLRELPQISSLGPDDTRSSGAQGAQQNITRGTSLNLRGVGPTATLLLVNGRRIPPTGAVSSFSDPSVISTDAVERIEVVADGASAIYGSDAIAGVVNIITRRRFDGLQLTAGYGDGDGFHQSKLSAIGGFSWGSGSVVATFESNYRTALEGAERDYFTQNLVPFGGRDYRSPNASPGNFLIGGVNYALPDTAGTALTPAQVAAGRGQTNLFDLSRANQIFPIQRRTNATLSVSQDITPGVRLTVDGFWFKRSFTSESVPVGTITVNNQNPFFVSPVAGQTSGTISYNFLRDVGRVTTKGGSRQWQANGELAIDLPAEWRASLSFSHGRNVDQNLGDDAFTTAAAVINPLLRDSNRATALNLFGNGTANNPDTLRKLFFADTVFRTEAAVTTGALKLDGSLFDLPAGQVKLAIGAERRHEFQSNFQSNNTGATLQQAVTLNFRGRRNVDSVFAEAFIPVLGEGSPVGRLDLSLAGRYEHYSDVGSTLNPKIGFNWVPVDGIKLHASYGSSFRAPTLRQTDSVQTTPTSAAGFVPDPTSPTGRSYAIVYTGGNPNLKPERAETYSAGIDFVPSSVPGLRVSANYFYIHYYDKIGQVAGQGGTTILQTEALYTPYILRNPTLAQSQAVIAASAALTQAGINPANVQVLIDGRTNNIGVSNIEGIDLAASYRFALGGGNLDIGASGLYYFGYDNAATDTLPLASVVNTINWPTRWRGQARVGWSDDTVRLGSTFNYTPSYRNNLVTPEQRVADELTVDVVMGVRFDAGRAKVLQGLELTFSIQNLLNNQPNFVNNPAGYGYDPQLASPLGRVLSVQLVKKF